MRLVAVRLVAALVVLCVHASGLRLGFQNIHTGGCSGPIERSWPWVANGQCAQTSASASIRYDCAQSRVEQFNVRECASSATPQSRDFACRVFNQSGVTYGISYSCADVPDTDLFAYTEGMGNCEAKNTVSLQMILKADECQGVWSYPGLPTRSYKLTRTGSTTVQVTTFSGNGICNGTGSNLQLSLLQECFSSGSSYRLIQALDKNSAGATPATMSYAMTLLILFIHVMVSW